MRTNLYEPPWPVPAVDTLEDLHNLIEGRFVYKIKGNERYSAQIRFPNGFRKCSVWYSLEDAKEWIDNNYDRLRALTDAIPTPEADHLGRRHYRLPDHIQ